MNKNAKLSPKVLAVTPRPNACLVTKKASFGPYTITN